ncbi:MAG: PD40 domain-containing protein [Anaerolineae bacterium]|nr:PD40 domain-containing protein [Anaerolineae bacterium]
MVSKRNHPLEQSHYDDPTLEEYVLGQLLPGEEEAIRQHLTECAVCRTKVAAYRAACQRIKSGLFQKLDEVAPGPRLSFDHIASEWRKPPRRITFLYRLQQLMPSTSSLVLLALFVVAFLLVMPPSDTAALRNLGLIEDYNGPRSVVAASTDDGLVILRLSAGDVEVVSHMSYMIDPRNLQFSPDGQWLALQQGRTLHIIETLNQGAHIRLDLDDSADWSWSPDGQRLAYTDGEGGLYVFDIATQTSRLLVPAEECAWGRPVWTSDGQQIAYSMVKPLPGSGASHDQQSIWRVDPSNGFRVELTRNDAPDDVLLVPAAWVQDDNALLVWDVKAGAIGSLPELYYVDAAAHHLEPLRGYSVAAGTRLAWPVSARGMVLAIHRDQLVFLDLDQSTRQSIPDQFPRPHNLAWAPNGAWMAYTVSGMAEGQGLYVFALQDGESHQVELPGGAVEKAVSWAGAEHLFVIRQPLDSSSAELWVVPLTTGQDPQRVLTNIRMPQTGPYVGWRWQDVLAMQVIQ